MIPESTPQGWHNTKRKKKGENLSWEISCLWLWNNFSVKPNDFLQNSACPLSVQCPKVIIQCKVLFINPFSSLYILFYTWKITILWTVLEDESEKEENCPFVLTKLPCHEGRSTCNANCDPIRRWLAVFQLNSSQAVLSQPVVLTGKKNPKTNITEPLQAS